ncbi:hypothetical protein NIES2135_61470 (plasmid) [Leptolyngbya boryana NIES-2135]|uniref:Uncharacterized protein n=2 Tax=Leptolyngbya group TaxID=3081713 RepID=A0A1Z4JRD0_LEPBY|nr:hypothetical protein [Leptolyngbya sp. FACHB-238]BAY59270.1 hypothetical protein NIES2135_61470 [Leptolyngbya boryana NIES-2135]
MRIAMTRNALTVEQFQITLDVFKTWREECEQEIEQSVGSGEPPALWRQDVINEAIRQVTQHAIEITKPVMPEGLTFDEKLDFIERHQNRVRRYVLDDDGFTATIATLSQAQEEVRHREFEGEFEALQVNYDNCKDASLEAYTDVLRLLTGEEAQL